MSNKFDPYRKWLGIPPAEQPPNHYRLLGIALFEDDPDVIAYAADRQMSHVRKFQAGRHGEHAQKLLSELAQARRCLLATKERDAYDATLKKELGRDAASPSDGRVPKSSKPVPAPPPPQPAPPQSTPPQPAPPQPAPPHSAPPVATLDASPGEPAPVLGAQSPPAAASPLGVRPRPVGSVARRRRKKSAMPLIAALCVVAGLAFAVLIVAILATANVESENTGGGDRNGVSQASRVETPDDAKAGSQRDRSSGPAEELNPAPPASGFPASGSSASGSSDTSVPDDAVGPSVPPASVPPEGEADSNGDSGADGGSADDDSADDDSADQQGRDEEGHDEDGQDDAGAPAGAETFEQAISAAEAALAQRNLPAAAKQIAAAHRLADGADEEVEAGGLRELYEYHKQFWEAVDRGLAKLRPSDEVGFADKIATFVSADGDRITLLVTGNRKTYAVRDLDPRFLVALAQYGLSSSDPQAKLTLAAFLASDGQDPAPVILDRAQSLYEEAAAGGATSAAVAHRLAGDQTPSLPALGGDNGPDPTAPPEQEAPLEVDDADGSEAESAAPPAP